MQSKLAGLHKYLIDSLKPFVHKKKIFASQAGGELIGNGEQRGNGGVIIANWRYDAAILVEDFPLKKCSSMTLLALVSCWLSEFDADRTENEDLNDPDIEVDVTSEESADVFIKLAFEEPLEIVPDPKGPIVFEGERYRVDVTEVWVANDSEISNATDDNA
ncbi:phage tail protein [Enterovibrio sp. ZSDZ42]|uniref:Phage tail protein n=1 Tax=Enterovibrio gelatinilyticus TaxID=2899819 RepID=A0ABT5QX64_9GAMM|nr:phage tail protein [Enterovibrio sp. ZSDZ42]MDD1792525.1 phage tail protein [Enterovibrio sp. ZSDZ42]